MASASPQCSPASVIPLLERCGYARANIASDYRPADAPEPGVLAFAHAPHDARTACIAVASAGPEPERTAGTWRAVGAPVLLLIAEDNVQWWMPRSDGVSVRETVSTARLDGFLEQHRALWAPETLYRAKTCGRLKGDYQLDFVDVGLLPFVEAEMGQHLSEFLESVLVEGHRLAGKPADDHEAAAQFQWMFESAFHLLAGKILHEKAVPGFQRLDTGDYEAVINRVRKHYGTRDRVRSGESWRERFLASAGSRTAKLSSLAGLTTETLALIYESALVSRETRQRLGTHSTPGYLVDYMVWGLADWIEAIPAAGRHVYEPCCGHAGFLIAAMRLLRDLHPGAATDQDMHEYLKARLHGFEYDRFALEIARLGLTLADVPNPNGWDLRQGDIFRSEWPPAAGPEADIVLMNPPFEDFGPEERERYAANAAGVRYVNKAAEVVARVLPRLNPGGVFGLVVPQGLLHGKNEEPLRRLLCREFELREITQFTDGLFSFSDAETAILLGRRHPALSATVHVGWVTGKAGIDRFRERQALSDVQPCPQQRLADAAGCELRIPRLDDVWRELECLPRLREWVKGGKGFEHLAKGNLPPGAQAVADRPFPGAVCGFTNVDHDLMLHGLPRERWVSLDPTHLRRPLHGTMTGQPQVLLNYARVDRGPWRLKAVVDPQGHAVSSRFVALRPCRPEVTLALLWAILNSPVGNGFAYCHFGGTRDNTVGELLQMPVPGLKPGDAERVVAAAQAYIDAAKREDGSVTPEQLKGLLLQVDAEVLRLYDLPPRLERRLLNLFSGYARLGVAFEIEEYFPADFTPCIPLHEYLSPDFKRTTAGELRKRLRPTDDPDIQKALRSAVDAFTLDEEAWP